MKLFQVNYLQDDDNGSYLTVGTNEDIAETITERELSSEKWNDESCLHYFNTIEIKEVDGYKIAVENKN